jgi:hypothetical protein
MMQYCNGLIGKHFKTLMQSTAFHVQDIITPDQLTLVIAMGELGPILWVPEIDNMETYLVCITSHINFLSHVNILTG